MLISTYLDCDVMDEEFLWTVFELSARSGFNDDLIRPFPSDYLLKDGTKGTSLPNSLFLVQFLVMFFDQNIDFYIENGIFYIENGILI